MHTHQAAAVALATFFIFSSTVFAAGPVPDAGSLLREQQQQQQPRLPDRLPAPDDGTVEQAPKTDSSIKVTVKGFRFSGISGMASEAELQELVKGAVGKEQTLADLQALAARVTRYLRDKGFFLARAYLPKQDITEGIIEIAVISGRVDGGATVRIAQPARIGPDILQGMLDSGVKSGEALHSSKLERSLMLINDLPGVGAKCTLERGAAYGTTKVLLDVVEGPLLSGGIFADNFGNRFTGTWRGTGFLSVNDPFGIGDQLSLSMTGAENLYQGRAAYSAQLHQSGLKGTVSFSSLYYKLGKELATLDAHGYADTIGASLGYPIIRSRSLSLWTNANYEYRMLDDYTLDSLTGDRDIHSGTVDLFSSSLDHFGGGGLTSIRLAFTVGDLALGNETNAQNDAATARTAGTYCKLGYSVARLQRLIDNLALFGSVSGQLALNKNLDSSEEFILGGPSGVRSYPTGEASGDEGHSFTLELRYDTPLPKQYGSLQLVGFGDAGTVTLHHKLWPNAVSTATGKNSYWLGGSGIGLNYSYKSLLALRGSWAHTIGSNDGRSLTGKDADNRSEDNRFWLQATVWF